MPGRSAWRPLAVFVALAIAALLCGCGSSSRTQAASVAPSVSGRASPSVVVSAPPSSTATASASASVSVVVDPTLLEVLPAAVDGIPLAFSPEASAEVAADPSLAGEVERVAYAVAVDAPEEELLVAAVAALREGVFDDAYFRTWREQYDREVCAQAGGVRAASLEVDIDGRDVFVGSCVNGGNTYHVWMADRELLLSAVAFGDRALGQRLVESLED
jgi:hypothetical protein